MKRRDAAAALAAAGLAPAAFAQGGPVEGRHYVRLGQPLPTPPGKIEVVEFFFYRCPHCFAFDPLLESWVHQLPADVSFRRVPVGQQALLKLHQRMFYALEAMGALTPAVHTGIFQAFHRQGVDANDEAAVTALVGRLGVDTAKFKQAFSSFGVQGKVAQGQKLAELAGADSVPALMIGGRWRTAVGMGANPGQSEAAQGQLTLAVADFLIKLSRGKG
ncbi:thiol:disulfide interchange protein DsbA/DsbL [Roseateles asaccharophilus]|uniref:Thiol:disulfide interchange protein n=1 Tax=Roseateles asaccharophilus TaxID=582607 RepID=A0ABU2AFA8_9BURK|nr:thiol:disulfide interchange protein DsbA/DsbL [Roseateles asaccharophilus]MDR7335157.1 thiol:disulfide interchange protein DsbA [Roseateles asaccharophilus]